MSNTPSTPERILYTAVATANAGRDGRVTSDDGQLDLAVAPPSALGGSGKGSNPEQLFAAGYAACFGSALSHVARAKKISIGTIAVTAHVGIGPIGQRYGLAVELVASLPQVSRPEGEALLRAAHEVCPYSNATRGNIPVTVRLA